MNTERKKAIMKRKNRLEKFSNREENEKIK